MLDFQLIINFLRRHLAGLIVLSLISGIYAMKNFKEEKTFFKLNFRYSNSLLISQISNPINITETMQHDFFNFIVYDHAMMSAVIRDPVLKKWLISRYNQQKNIIQLNRFDKGVNLINSIIGVPQLTADTYLSNQYISNRIAKKLNLEYYLGQYFATLDGQNIPDEFYRFINLANTLYKDALRKDYLNFMSYYSSCVNSKYYCAEKLAQLKYGYFLLEDMHLEIFTPNLFDTYLRSYRANNFIDLITSMFFCSILYIIILSIFNQVRKIDTRN